MKKQRRYSTDNDGETVCFDIGDVVCTKYGDVDIITDITETDIPNLPMVHFANTRSFSAHRISSRTNLAKLQQCRELDAVHRGFIPKSRVKNIQHNDIVYGTITNTYYSDSLYRMVIVIQVDGSLNELEFAMKDLVMVERYQTTKDKVLDLILEHTYMFGKIKDRDGLVDKLVAMIDSRKNKIERIKDDL